MKPEKSDYEYGYEEALIEVGSSDSSEGFEDNTEVEIEIEYPKDERKLTKLNEEYMKQYKAQPSYPESAKNKLLYTQNIRDEKGEDMKAKFKFDDNLQRLSESQGMDFLKKLAKDKKAVNYRLRLAVEKGDIKTIRIIIDKDLASRHQLVDLNEQTQDQWTLLHIATSEGNYSIVRYLLEKGADPNTQSVNRRTALHIACMRGHLSIVNILIQYKADLNIADMDGNTAVHLCSEFGKLYD